jgi:hypothetical protein
MPFLVALVTLLVFPPILVVVIGLPIITATFTTFTTFAASLNKGSSLGLSHFGGDCLTILV